MSFRFLTNSFLVWRELFKIHCSQTRKSFRFCKLASVLANDLKNVFFYQHILIIKISSVQILSCVWLFATPWAAAHQASLSITNSRSLLKFTSIESVMPSSHLILCRHSLYITLGVEKCWEYFITCMNLNRIQKVKGDKSSVVLIPVSL